MFSTRQLPRRPPGHTRPATLTSRRQYRGCAAREQKTPELSRWGFLHEHLNTEQLETITPQEAKDRCNKGGWILVDVRLREQYNTGHAAGAVSVPIYNSIGLHGANFTRVIKYLLYKSNGVHPVDVNEQFDEQLQVATDGGSMGVVLMCEAGGTMQPSVNFPLGKSSRSLQAAYRALKGGFLASKVAHMDRGLYGWFQSDLPMVGDYMPEIGRTPNAATITLPHDTATGLSHHERNEEK